MSLLTKEYRLHHQIRPCGPIADCGTLVAFDMYSRALMTKKNASHVSAAPLGMHWWLPESLFTEGKAGSEREVARLRLHSNLMSISSSSPLSTGPIFNYKGHKGHLPPQGQRANPTCPPH